MAPPQQGTMAKHSGGQGLGIWGPKGHPGVTTMH